MGLDVFFVFERQGELDKFAGQRRMIELLKVRERSPQETLPEK